MHEKQTRKRRQIFKHQNEDNQLWEGPDVRVTLTKEGGEAYKRENYWFFTTNSQQHKFVFTLGIFL